MTILSGMPLPGEVVSDVTSLVRLRDELADLAECPGAASGIVQHPDWLLFELETRGERVSPCVVIARGEDSRIIGYLPLLAEQQTVRIAVGSAKLPIYRGRVLRLLGAGVVASPTQRERVTQAIVDALRGERWLRILRIQESELPNELAASMAGGTGGFASVNVNLLDQLDWTICPQGSLDNYLAALGSKRRNDLSRRLRNVYKKLGEQAQLRIFDSPEQVDEYTRLMNQLYATTWHAAVQTIDWELPARRSLFRKLAGRRELVGHMLLLGTRPIAYVHGYRLGGRYLLDDTGYDEEFSALGVGSALVFQAVQDLIKRHPDEWIDFGYGDNQYKRVLGDRQTPCGSLYVVRGISPRLCFGMVAPLRWIYRRLHGMRRRLRSPGAAH